MNPYGIHGAPTVGRGIPGLPRRSARSSLPPAARSVNWVDIGNFDYTGVVSVGITYSGMQASEYTADGMRCFFVAAPGYDATLYCVDLAEPFRFDKWVGNPVYVTSYGGSSASNRPVISIMPGCAGFTVAPNNATYIACYVFNKVGDPSSGNKLTQLTTPAAIGNYDVITVTPDLMTLYWTATAGLSSSDYYTNQYALAAPGSATGAVLKKSWAKTSMSRGSFSPDGRVFMGQGGTANFYVLAVPGEPLVATAVRRIVVNPNYMSSFGSVAFDAANNKLWLPYSLTYNSVACLSLG